LRGNLKKYIQSETETGTKLIDYEKFE